jgi:endonuclease/exonuclease/phosphatase family metal-dependent hydrolase
VASWNLLHGLDVRTGRIDLGAVAAGLDALDVEVVAVQEVDREQRRTGGVDQVAELARRLGWHGVFAPALLGEPARRWEPGPGAGPDPGGPAYGIGLLSRHPLLHPERMALPGGGAGERRPEDVGRTLPGLDHEPRVVLRARVAAPGGRSLVVATSHLSYLAWRGVRQLRRAASWVTGCGGPAVLMGDLNLPVPLLRPALTGTGWAAVPASATFPSWRPGMQLDHLLARGVRVCGAVVGPRGPSDHLPISARIVLP